MVLSLDPASRGLGFTIFDAPQSLLDWGYSDIRFNKKHRILNKVRSLIDLYNPDLIVLEDAHVKSARRSQRIRNLLRDITELALKNDIPVRHYSVRRMHDIFSVKNKAALSQQIAEFLPELSPYTPPLRKPWMTQNPHHHLFTAASLALTYYYLES